MLTKKKFANTFSTIGNPLILSFIVSIYANFREFDTFQAIKLTAILLVIGILPIWFFINRKVKSGDYADHDVSARTKRKSLYVFALTFLMLMIAVLYFTNQPKFITTGALFAWILAFSSFLINFKVKSSLHTGFAFLIAMMTFKIGIIFSMSLLVFAFLIAWSRVYLKRHTLQEVFIGGSLGFVLGSVYQYVNDFNF